VHFDITSIADSNLSVVIPYGNADGAAYEWVFLHLTKLFEIKNLTKLIKT
jgi:hypothetical protein